VNDARPALRIESLRTDRLDLTPLDPALDAPALHAMLGNPDVHRYDTDAERLLLNRIWARQTLMTNYFYPQQKLVSKIRRRAKVIKKHDLSATPHQRAERHVKVTKKAKTAMSATYTKINPAAVQREIQALTEELLTLTTAKAAARTKPGLAKRASTSEATTSASRAS